MSRPKSEAHKARERVRAKERYWGNVESERERFRIYHHNNRPKILARKRKTEMTEKTVHKSNAVRIAQRMIREAKKRSREKGWPWDDRITVEWVVGELLPEWRCSKTGEPYLDIHLPKGQCKRPWAPSMDRIDSSKPYTIENIRFVCAWVNRALNNDDDWIAETFMKERADRPRKTPPNRLNPAADEIEFEKPPKHVPRRSGVWFKIRGTKNNTFALSGTFEGRRYRERFKSEVAARAFALRVEQQWMESTTAVVA